MHNVGDGITGLQLCGKNSNTVNFAALRYLEEILEKCFGKGTRIIALWKTSQINVKVSSTEIDPAPVLKVPVVRSCPVFQPRVTFQLPDAIRSLKFPRP